jgi:hypothetical protein
MKLIHAVLISGAVIVPAIVYVSLSDNTLTSSIRPSVEHGKPIAHRLALEDSDVNLGESLAALRKEVAGLKADVLALQSAKQTQQLRLDAVSQHAVSNPVKPQLAREQILAKEKERLRVRGEQLETGFRQQTTDPAWSARAKTLVLDALASDKVASKDIIDIECRTSKCRVELANDANGEEVKLSDFPMKISEELPNILVNQTKESDGSTTTVLYLSKDDLISPNSGS